MNTASKKRQAARLARRQIEQGSPRINRIVLRRILADHKGDAFILAVEAKENNQRPLDGADDAEVQARHLGKVLKIRHTSQYRVNDFFTDAEKISMMEELLEYTTDWEHTARAIIKEMSPEV